MLRKKEIQFVLISANVGESIKVSLLEDYIDYPTRCNIFFLSRKGRQKRFSKLKREVLNHLKTALIYGRPLGIDFFNI